MQPAGVSRRTDYSVDYYLLDATDDAADVADFVALAPDSSRRVAAGQSLAVVGTWLSHSTREKKTLVGRGPHRGRDPPAPEPMCGSERVWLAQ